MAAFGRDDNRVPVIGGQSTTTGLAIPLYAVPLTGVNAMPAVIYDGNGNLLSVAPPPGALKTVTGTVSSSGNNTVITAVANRKLKIFAYALFTSSTSAVTATFQDGATPLWTVPLQAISGTYFGANLTCAYPTFLFSTASGDALALNLSSNISVTYSIGYWDTDAS